ncbi:MAG: FAD-dependent oxidoreductase [Gemmatimonadetes bacterium]|nr:FAD-dependent oxidoreductase [Gemmatimonadota bacterium]
MAKPVIMAVDDQPQVLNAITRDLNSHYQKDFHIVQAASGADALEAVREFKRRDTPVALFVVDQRMPEMSGTEFLDEAIKLYPHSKRVLLTAYADTDAAIASINAIGLDYYLMKPWDPPAERLYPVLDDLLGDWLASVPVPYDGIRVAGTLWSAKAHAVKEFLARNQVPYRWMDVERDAQARELVEASSGGRPPLPILFFPDGSLLADPDIRTLAEKVGLRTPARQPFYDLVIVGAGPAGLAAAVYGASEGLRTVAIEREAAGGQAGTSARIENYLGFPNGIMGGDLARRALTQAKRLGAEVLSAHEVVGLRVEDPYRIVTLDDGSELSCHALLLATGVKVRELDVPGLERLVGTSVYYGAATSEVVNYKGGRVFVVGGANSAGQGAIYLSRYASQVTLLVRADSLKASMSSYLVDQIERTESISVRFNSEVTAVTGGDHVESIEVKDMTTGETEPVPADAMFIFIGAIPASLIAAGVVERSDDGFILTGPDLIRNGRRPKGWRLNRDPFLMETSVPGIFAAGDVRFGVVRRVASAVGQGATVVSLVHKYLETV